MPAPVTPEPKIKPLQRPLWTENKAKLIERYLFYFVMVTKHGTYIDGFAGPQNTEHQDMWSARLVLETQPRWLRKFHLYDIDREQAERLSELKRRQPPRNARLREPRRSIDIKCGDFNQLAHELLRSGDLRPKEATFCLLDQRTFECQWSTVKALAAHRGDPYKMELFYFLPNAWLDRAVHALHDKSIVRRWWGNDDWQSFVKLPASKRVQTFAQRFKAELGYASAKPWPIYKNEQSARIMYYMIHATDHPEAPSLMNRAYRYAVEPSESVEQLKLEFGIS